MVASQHFLFQSFIWLSGKDTSCFTEAEVFLPPPQIDFLTPGVISHRAKAMVRSIQAEW
jgi:hypothetical protein